MANYIISFSDPAKSGTPGNQAFTVAASGFDGPGGNTAHSTLRLYGRGALEWGQSVDENQLRTLENYASATPPIKPIEGQLWYAVALYWNTGSSWYRFNYQSSTPGSAAMWDPLSITYTVATLANLPNLTASPSDYGTYGYVTSTQTLYRWDTPYTEAAAQWMPRMFVSSVTPPSISTFPETHLYIYSLATTVNGGWINPPAGAMISESAPLKPTNGLLWYKTSTRTLSIYNSTLSAFEVSNQTVFDVRYLRLDGTSSMLANLNLGNNKLVNVATPTAGTDGTNKAYVDAAVSTGVGSYVPISGTTMTGELVLYGNPTQTYGATPKNYVDNAVNAKVNKSGDTMSGYLTLNANPVNSLHAATKQYVDNNVTFTLPLYSIIAYGGPVTIGVYFTASGLGMGPLAGTTGTWAICNGNNGTPNLINQFILGAAAPGATGGSTTTSSTGAGGFNTSNLTGITTFNANVSIPAHQHYIFSNTSTVPVDLGGTPIISQPNNAPAHQAVGGNAYREYGITSGAGAASSGVTSVAGSGSGSHNHTIADPTHSHSFTPIPHTHTITPPYYSLVFIMRVA